MPIQLKLVFKTEAFIDNTLYSVSKLKKRMYRLHPTQKKDLQRGIINNAYECGNQFIYSVTFKLGRSKLHFDINVISLKIDPEEKKNKSS